MNTKAESNYFSVSPLVLSGKTSSRLNLLFNWLDLLASEEPKTASGKTPRSRLTLNTTIHEIRENSEDINSQRISLVSPNSKAQFEFIRFPVSTDRKVAETIANFTFMRPGGTSPHTISAEIKEEPYPLAQINTESMKNLEPRHKIFTLHDVNMSGREPQSLEEKEHRTDLLNKFRMVLNQLFCENSLKEIISS